MQPCRAAWGNGFALQARMGRLRGVTRVRQVLGMAVIADEN